MINRQVSDDQDESVRTLQDQETSLLGELRRLLDQPSTAETRRKLLQILDVLLVNLARHLALACRDGYLSVVLEQRPGWHRQIEALRGANIWCISALRELYDHIEHESPSATIETKESGDVNIWIRSLATIRGHECRLLQGAFTLDIGGEA